MRKISWVFVLLFSFAAESAAQTAATVSSWDSGATVGLITARMPEIDQPYYQDWYEQGRYAASIGHYITSHTKVEFEHSWSGTGTRQLFDLRQVNGQVRPFQIDQSFQLQQSTLRVIYQFRDNASVHPYLGAGAVLDVERQQTGSAHRTELRGGVSFNGGAKFYMTPRAFFNTGAIITYSKPVGTVSFIAGFGIDF